MVFNLKSQSILFLVLTLVSGNLLAGHDPLLESRVLRDKTRNLHQLVRTQSIYPIAAQAACDLDDAAKLLLRRAECPRDLEPLGIALHEVQRASGRMAMIVERICDLRDNPAIRRELDCVLRQVARTQVSVQHRLAGQYQQPQPRHPSFSARPQWERAPSFGQPQPFGHSGQPFEQPGSPYDHLGRTFNVGPDSRFDAQSTPDFRTARRLAELEAERSRRSELTLGNPEYIGAPPAPWERNLRQPTPVTTERPGLAIMGLILSELSRR